MYGNFEWQMLKTINNNKKCLISTLEINYFNF
jgi:hypothetical protein